MLFEKYMYADINDFISQNSYFLARDIVEEIHNSISENNIEFDGDCLELIETLCNCCHVHEDILADLLEEVQHEVWNLGEAVSLNICGNKIFWKNNII